MIEEELLAKAEEFAAHAPDHPGSLIFRRGKTMTVTELAAILSTIRAQEAEIAALNARIAECDKIITTDGEEIVKFRIALEVIKAETLSPKGVTTLEYGGRHFGGQHATVIAGALAIRSIHDIARRALS
jgi:hypothetical protein